MIYALFFCYIGTVASNADTCEIFSGPYVTKSECVEILNMNYPANHRLGANGHVMCLGRRVPIWR